jgi:hypothetical protein
MTSAIFSRTARQATDGVVLLRWSAVPFSTPRRLLPLLVLPLALGAAACGDDDDDDAGPTTASTAEVAPSTTTAGTSEPTSTTTTVAEPEGTVIEVDVVGGEPEGGARTVEVAVGEDVTLRVRSDVEDEVHVHGYDLFVDVAPGAPGELTFVAEIPGQFEIELEGAHTLLVDLVVS